MAWEPVDPQSDAPPGLGFDPRKTRATDIDPYVYGGEPVQQPRMDIPVATPLPGLAIEPAQRKPGAMVGLAMRINDLLGRQQPAEYAPYQPLPPAAPVVTPQEPQPGNWQPVTLEADVGKAALHFGPQVARSAVEGFGDVARGAGQAAGAAGRAGWGPARDYQQVMKALAAKGAGKDVNGVEPTPPLYAPPTEQGYSTADIAKVSGERPAIVTAYEQVGGLLDAAGTGMKQWAGETFPGRQAPTFDAVHDWRSALVYGMESTAQASGSTLPMLTTYMVAGPFAAAIPTYAQSIGQMRASMEEAGLNPKEQDAIILAGGAIMGRIEMMSHGALSSLFKEQLGQHVVRRMMSAGVRGGATEGMEEILQEATQIAGEAIAKGENVGLELLSDKGLARMKEAGVGAFVGGFGLGAGGTGGRYAGRALADQYRAWGEARDRTAAGDTTLSPTDLGHVSIFPERQGDGKSEPLAAITVHHGTPHHFGRFDSSKIGTGERAQAFGHGLYFAEEKGVAEGYRDRLAPKPDVDFSSASSIASEALRVYGDRQKALESFKSDLARYPDHPNAQLYRGAIAAIEDGINPRQSFGAVYTVAINAEPHQFLDWDAPWSQQPPQVLEAFAKLGMPKSITEPTMDGREPTGATVYGRLEQALEDRMLANHAEANKGVYPPPPTDYGPDMSRAASEALRSVGIKGARYFDQMSRQKGEGTRNYVVYDDSILDITHKNGKPVDAKTRDAIAAEVAPLSAVSSGVDEARARAEKFKKWKEKKEFEALAKPKTTVEIISSRLAEGTPVSFPETSVRALNDVIRPLLGLLPQDAHAGFVSRIEAVDPIVSRSGVVSDTKVTLTSPNGYTFDFIAPREFVLNSNAIFIHSRSAIGFITLGLFDELGEASRGRVKGDVVEVGDNVRKRIVGTFLHEATHLLSRRGVMPFDDWRRLVDHSNSIGVLDVPLRSYFQVIGDENYSTVSPSKTIRQAYEEHYRGYSNIAEAIDQEAAAIMVQLVAHGVIDKSALDPVADIFDKYYQTTAQEVGTPFGGGDQSRGMLASIAQEPRSPFGRVRSLFNRFRGGQDGRQNDGPDAPGPSLASRDATAGGPGAREADIAGGDAGTAGQRHGDQAQFRLNGGYRGHVVQIVDARTGQPRREYYVYGQKGSPASGDYSPTTSLRVMKGTPNWLSRATLIQRKDGEWEVSGIAVRKGARRRGIATNLLDAIDESLGSKVRPAEHLRLQEHEFWKRRDPIAVSDYVRFDGDFYTPERLYGLHQSFVHIAATGSKLARAQAGNAVRRIEHALKKTLPESVVPRGDDFLLAIGRHEEEWEESWWQSLADRDARIEARRMPDQMPARQRFDRSALEVAADRLLREIRQSEVEMRAAGLGAEEIARGLSDLFGVGVDADQISQGDTWWSVPKSPEYTEMPAPATTGAAPVLRRADVAERVISAEHSGLGDGEVAARMSEEFGRPIPETLIADIRKEHAPVRGRHIKARTIAALTTLYRQGVPHKDAAKQISDMLGTPIREKWVRDTVHRQGIVKSSADEATRRAGTARTPERLAELVDVLRQGKTYDDAAAELSKRWGVPVSRAWVNISVTRHKLAAQITPSADRRGVARTPERMAELSGLLQQGMTSSEAAAELSRRWGRPVNGTWVTNSIAKHGLRHEAGPTSQVVEQPLFAISGRAPTSRTSLVNVLRGFGGIQDVTGDLRAILDRPGAKGYIPGIINKNGLHPDMARERLVEMGYILDDGSLGGEATSTVDDLYDLVRRLANGERVYPRTAEGETERAADEAVLREDENLFAVERALADLDDYIEKSGLSPLTASERDSAAALIQHNPTPDEMDDLIERLYNETYQAEIEKAYAKLTTNEARIAVALQSEGLNRDDAIEQARQIEENRLAEEDIARQKDRGARQDAAEGESGAGTVGAAGQVAASVGGAGAQGQLNLGSRQTAPGTGGAPPLPPGGGRMGPPPLPPSPPPPGAPGNYARALEVVGQQIVPSVKPHWWQNVSWDKFYTRIKDDLHPLAVVRKGLYGKNASVNIDEDFYRLARLTRGSYGLGEHFIRYGTFDYNTRRNTGQSLETILAPVKDDLKSFQSYMVARRSLELSAQGKQTGVPFWAATAVVNGGRAKYEAPFQNILKYQDSLLKYLVDSGLVDPAHAANMRQMHKSYVPFFRLSDETIDQNGPGRNIKTWNPIKRLKGSDKKIIEPIESIVRNTFTYVALAERNRALRAFADGIDKSPVGAQFATKVPPKLAPIHVTDREIDRFLQSYGVAPVGQSMTIFRPRAFTPAKDEIAVFRNGKRDVYKVDPEVANAVNGMNAKTVPVLWDLLALPARMLRAGATLAPEFMVRNPVRDQFTALAASRNGYLPVYSFVRGLGHVLKKSGIYQQWLKSGGANSAMVSMDRDYINQQVIRLSDPTFIEKAGNVLRTPIEILRTISEVMENATRVGEFEAGMGRGKDIKESGFDSREVTLDFARMGAQGQAINMIVAFWNAQVEGIDRAVRAFKENPGKFTASMALSITLPSILLWFANKDDPRWKELPAYQRDMFWLIMTNKWRPASKEDADNVPAAYKRQAPDGSWEINDGTIWRIPKPFELGILFGSVPERMLDRFYADRPDAFKGFSSSLFGAFLPSFIPQFATPVLEHWGNRSLFLDRALVPKSLEGLEPRYQETPFTSELAKKIGRAIGEVSPDTSIGSPIVIDNYIRAWTGGLGQHVLNMMDAAARKSGISPARIEPSPTLADLPVIKAFVVRYPSASAQSIQDFYDEYERRQKAKASVRYLEKNDRAAEAEELRQSRALVTAEGVHKALAGQHKLARDIYNSKDMTPEEKRRLLDNLYLHMIQIAQRGLESFGASRAPPRGPAQSASPPNWQPVTLPAPQWQPVAPQSPPSNWQPVVPP